MDDLSQHNLYDKYYTLIEYIC